METFWQVVFMFVVLPVIGTLYVNGVHRLGAVIVRNLPAKYVRILSKRLYLTAWDKARPYDRIALEAEDKLNRRNLN